MNGINPVQKPGKKKKKTKKTPYVKAREIEPPDDTYCRSCGLPDDGTCCYRHAESRIIKFEFNGGGSVGSKISDRLTGWICQKCDDILSKPLPKNASEEELKDHAIDWFKVIIKSHLI